MWHHGAKDTANPLSHQVLASSNRFSFKQAQAPKKGTVMFVLKHFYYSDR